MIVAVLILWYNMVIPLIGEVIIVAIIKCPFCGKEISDKASKCIHCEKTLSTVICSDCGKEYVSCLESCPFCGCPNRNNDPKTLNTYNKQNNHEKKSRNVYKRIVLIIGIICVLAIASVTVYYISTKNERIYQSGIELINDEKYTEAISVLSEIKDYKDVSEKIKECQYELTTDRQFIRELSDGLQERWKKSDEAAAQGVFEDHKLFSDLCDVELNHVANFAEQDFEDEKLKESAVSYIEAIKQAKDATNHYTVDYNTYLTMWNDAYAKRCVLIKDFVDKYGLTVSESNQEALNDLLMGAEAVAEQSEIKSQINTMIDNFRIDTSADEWGYKTYKISMKNTTNRTFDNFYVEIQLMDENDVIIYSGTSSNITSWEPEQEVYVDAFFDGEIDPNDYKIEYIPRYQTGTYFE